MGGGGGGGIKVIHKGGCGFFSEISQWIQNVLVSLLMATQIENDSFF